jgi:hypothetical protein
MKPVANHQDHKEVAMKTESSTVPTKEADLNSFQELFQRFMVLAESAEPRPNLWFLTLVLCRDQRLASANRSRDFRRFAAIAV